MAVACSDDNCVDAYTQDLGFVAESRGDELAGFNRARGRRQWARRTESGRRTRRLGTPLCFARPGELLQIAETIVTIQRDYGDRKNANTRAHEVPPFEECGITWLRDELERRLGRPVERPHVVAFTRVEDHLGWHEQRMTEPGISGSDVENGACG